jgi:DNA-binding response OmpR family regulator
METILVVEDDPAIVSFIQPALEREGFLVQAVGDGEAALAHVRRRPPDLILLDWELPRLNGLEVCRQVRRGEPYVPVIMLTVRDQDTDKVVGLEIGADDYITKPFNVRELVARIRAVLRLTRQARPAGRDYLRVEEIEIDRARRTVTVGGRQIQLAPKEYDLLVVLAWDRGRAFGREMLLERIWGYDYTGGTRTVDVHVGRLRSKIEADPAQPRYLVTVRGFGYKFAGEDDL